MPIDERIIVVVPLRIRHERPLRIRLGAHVVRPRPVQLRLAAHVPHLGRNLALRVPVHPPEQLDQRHRRRAVRFDRVLRVFRAVREDQHVRLGEHRRQVRVVVVRPVDAEAQRRDALDAVPLRELRRERLAERAARPGHRYAPIAERDGRAGEPVEDVHHRAEVVLRVDVVHGVVLGPDEEEVRVLGDAAGVGDVVGVAAFVPVSRPYLLGDPLSLH